MVACEMVGVSVSLVWVIWKVDTSVAHDCLWFLKNSYWYAGGGGYDLLELGRHSIPSCLFVVVGKYKKVRRSIQAHSY